MKITETNGATGETIEREATETEIAELTYQAELAAEAKAEEERIAAEKAAAKIALLDRLGLTEEEAKLLLA